MRSVCASLSDSCCNLLARACSAAIRSWLSSSDKRLLLVLALDRQALQRLAAAVDLDELLGGLLAQRLDADFEPARRHGELGPHAVLVGLDLGQRQRHRSLDALARQRDGAPPDRRRNQQRQKAGAQKAEDEEQDRLNQGDYPVTAGVPAIGDASRSEIRAAATLPCSHDGNPALRQELCRERRCGSTDALIGSKAGSQHGAQTQNGFQVGLCGQLQIAEIDAEPRADAGADRHQQHIVVLQHVEADAGHDIGRTGNAAEAVVEVADVVEIVDQHHHPRSLAAEIPAERRALPEHLMVAGILGVERAFAIGQAADHRAGALLAEQIAVGQAVGGENLLDDGGQPARRRAEELVTGIDDLLSGVFLRPRRRG